jgi:hypothetical protein
MKKLITLAILAIISLGLTGCGDSGSSGSAVGVGGTDLFVDPHGRYSIIYAGWYHFDSTSNNAKRTTWHTNITGDVILGITDWKPNGPAGITVLEWAQDNRDRLIAEGYNLVKDISSILNGNGNTGYEFTIRKGITEWRVAFFFNNLTEQFDLTFEYDAGNPEGNSLTQIIKGFKTKD